MSLPSQYHTQIKNELQCQGETDLTFTTREGAFIVALYCTLDLSGPVIGTIIHLQRAINRIQDKFEDKENEL